MSDERHKCKGCDRQIPLHFIHCLFCVSKLNQKGLCGRCGERPRRPKNQFGKQSKYCDDCIVAIETAADDRAKERGEFSHQKKFRNSDARELTHETKWGTGH